MPSSVVFLVLVCIACGTTPTIIVDPTEVPAGEIGSEGLLLGDQWERMADGMTMVYVPAGEFRMGSSNEDVNRALQLCPRYPSTCMWDYRDEQPAHDVTLSGFWIDRTEVTNGQYEMCVEAGVCDPPMEITSSTRDMYYGESDYDDYPVVYVNWYQAAAYCEWVKARLPTEAEWEYAARGSERREYPWGDTLDGTRLNYCDANCALWMDDDYDDGYADTAPVGNYLEGASWCGALDLAGNVFEWTADQYGMYPSERQENPTGPTSEERRVIRGGSWMGDWYMVRTAYRLNSMPDDYDYHIGFRCAKSSSE